jgi:hypothetical protein
MRVLENPRASFRFLILMGVFFQTLTLTSICLADSVDDQRRTIAKGLFDAKSCYVDRLSKKHRSHGQVFIEWKIDRSGNVLSAESNEDLTDIGDQKFISCVLDYARKWKFAPNKGGKAARFGYAIWVTDKGKRIEISLGD